MLNLCLTQQEHDTFAFFIVRPTYGGDPSGIQQIVAIHKLEKEGIMEALGKYLYFEKIPDEHIVTAFYLHYGMDKRYHSSFMYAGSQLPVNQLLRIIGDEEYQVKYK